MKQRTCSSRIPDERVAGLCACRQPAALAKPLHDTRAVATRQLDEMAAYKLFETIGVPHAPAVALDIDADRSSGAIKIAGAMYNLRSGTIDFLGA